MWKYKIPKVHLKRVMALGKWSNFRGQNMTAVHLWSRLLANRQYFEAKSIGMLRQGQGKASRTFLSFSAASIAIIRLTAAVMATMRDI